MTAPSPPRVRVLLCDDHPLLRRGVAAVLSSEPDLEVVGEVSDGQEAIEAYRRLRPDVLLLDLKMPHMDGPETIRRLRAEFPDARILMLTVHAGDEDVVQCLRGGALGYVLKAAPAEEVLLAVRRVAEGKKYVAQSVGQALTDRLEGNDLTAREREVLRLLVQGLDNRQIARALGIADSTAKWHVLAVFSKLGVNDRANAVRIALQRGLVHLP